MLLYIETVWGSSRLRDIVKKLSERNLTLEYNIKQTSDRMKIVAKLRRNGNAGTECD